MSGSRAFSMSCSGFDRAIVSELAGTTRDTIEEMINLRGIPLRLIDTAGVRESEDEIERQGIDRTEQQLERADLVLEIVDISQERGRSIGVPPGKHHLRVLNKSDLGRHPSREGEAGIETSCLRQDGVEGLADEIYRTLTSGEVPMARRSDGDQHPPPCLPAALLRVCRAWARGGRSWAVCRIHLDGRARVPRRGRRGDR